MAEVGRDLWRSSVPTPLLKQTAQDGVQMDFEYILGQRAHNLPAKPVPELIHPYCKEVFPDVQMNTPAFQFLPFASDAVTGHH